MNDVIEKIVKQSSHLSWMRDGVIYLTLYGSKAYGTDTPTSDEDYKGVAIPPKQYFYGFQHKFEQAELKEPDTVIYDIRKFFNLASNANPSIIETLYTDDKDRVLVSPIGEILLANRDRFLSKRVRYTFAGYSRSQLNRIQLHRRYLLNPPTHFPTRKEFGLPEETLIPADQLIAAEAEIKKELEKYQFDFLGELSEPMKIMIRNSMSDILTDLKISKDDQWLAASRKVGFNDNFIEFMKKERAYKNLKTEWDNFQTWKKNRNVKRAADEAKFGYDAKHAYHLIRLMRMCREILTTGKVIVKRPDREELLAIRNGAWSYEQIVEFAEREDKDLQLVYETSNVLPKTPDIKFLDNLCVELVARQLCDVY